MFEIPQARRRTRRRSVVETIGRHLALRWQIFACMSFLIVVAAVILWAYETFPTAGKGA